MPSARILPMPRPKGDPTRTYNVRVPVADFELWEAAARAEGFDVADLVRTSVKREAERILEAKRSKRSRR